MNDRFTGAQVCGALRNGLLALTSAASVGAAAQVPPMRYQLCEAQAPAPDARHRIDTNYRYPPAAASRSLRGFPAYRCEPAWVQSPAIFDAVGVCPSLIAGCSADVQGTCQDNPEDWIDHDFHGATLWSGEFTHESLWEQNALVRQHTGMQGVTQWTRHRWWGWAFPARYAYVGLVERPFSMAAQSHPKCYGMAYMVGLFNGVWNTPRTAVEGFDAVRASDFVGPAHSNAPIKYQLFYNQTGCSRSGMSCLEDLSEVFMQRSAEMDGLLARRWEYFWEQVTGQAGAQQSITTLLITRAVRSVDAFIQWRDALGQAILARITALTAALASNPPTMADTATHVADLIRHGRQGYRAVLVGHSQGNLFANAAYQGYLAHSREAGTEVGQDTGYVAASIVHIAPASAVLRGPHVLAEIDLVINGLRNVDGAPVAPNTLGRDIVPSSTVDLSGHRLVETYLDAQRGARREIQRLIIQAMDML